MAISKRNSAMFDCLFLSDPTPKPLNRRWLYAENSVMFEEDMTSVAAAPTPTATAWPLPPSHNVDWGCINYCSFHSTTEGTNSGNRPQVQCSLKNAPECNNTGPAYLTCEESKTPTQNCTDVSVGGQKGSLRYYHPLHYCVVPAPAPQPDRNSPKSIDDLKFVIRSSIFPSNALADKRRTWYINFVELKPSDQPQAYADVCNGFENAKNISDPVTYVPGATDSDETWGAPNGTLVFPRAGPAAFNYGCPKNIQFEPTQLRNANGLSSKIWVVNVAGHTCAVGEPIDGFGSNKIWCILSEEEDTCADGIVYTSLLISKKWVNKTEVVSDGQPLNLGCDAHCTGPLLHL